MFLSSPKFYPVRDNVRRIKRDPVTGLALFTMSEDLHYISPTGEEHIVPALEPSDMGSISNWVLRAFLSPHEVEFRRAFRLHDYLYCGGTNRLEADLVFHAALREEGADFIRALLAFTAVRIFGWSHYRKANK